MTRRPVHVAKNDGNRLCAICRGKACEWYVYARKIESHNNTDYVVITMQRDHAHTCSQVLDQRWLTSKWLVERYLEKIKANPHIPLSAIRQCVDEEFGLKVGRMKAYRARDTALEGIFGKAGRQYRKLFDYKSELERTHPGSSVHINTYYHRIILHAVVPFQCAVDAVDPKGDAFSLSDERSKKKITMLDVVRANTFVAEVLGLDPREVSVPVVGGHAGVTILPLLSQVKPACSFTKEETEYLTSRIQNGGTEVVEAKAGAGSATLSMAYAAVKFADACLRGLRGDAGVIECAFVPSQVTELPFFASRVRLGRSGVEEIYPLGPLNEYERSVKSVVSLEKAKKELGGSIDKGVSFAKKFQA
ncbi:malate dehydrogenase, chloroplastic-like [Salvia splendens]|uniref:malate dehydrogenase, chloroplastic-like n=1 Tax=Salvia splendens TaxID=180675 RepID=UPI001C255408|nr:malate dehydrogenase, chloroplastic-like [Salvia splendens]